jgi:DNA-binding NarL/FixJ family response regulator
MLAGTVTRHRLVIADDHAAMLGCVQELLEREFEIVATASDGRSAVDLAQRLQPDAVVLDIEMPVLNGLEAAAELATLTPSPRVVFLTVSADPAYRRAAIEMGAAGYVLKSRMASRLVPALYEALGSC